MMRNVVIFCMCLSFLSCAAAAPLNIRAVPDEVCATDVQPPVPSAAEDPAIQAPVALQRVEPHVDESLRGRTARAAVEAVIGEDGVPRNICVVSGDPEWGRAVAAALRQWKFQPGTRDGKPLAVRFTLTTNLQQN